MKLRHLKRFILFFSFLSGVSQACAGLLPLPNGEVPPRIDEVHTEVPVPMPQNGFPDKPAIPNDSGIEGVHTYPDKSEYHNHIASLSDPEGTIPPPFGAHLSAWQNCGIYDQPVGLGNALHSTEHGAVWLTYSPDLSESLVIDLQKLVQGHGYVLMSPYPPQKKPVILTAWGVQLIIDTLPDDRIAKFIAYYELGPQNPEPGAPCSGAIGIPLP